MLRFSLLFPVLFIGLFALELLKPVEEYVLNPFTNALAAVSTFLIGLFDSDATSYGRVIQSASNGFAVSIERGCNGVEAVIILFSAIFAFPARWNEKLLGFAVGFVAIQALNLVRIISLFYIGQWSMTWFEWFHLYLWQALIIIDALVVWLLWLRWLARRHRPAAPAAPAPIVATA